jgi:hypothetical protein
VTGGDKSPSAVNLSSSNIITVILSVLTPVVSETLIFLVALVFNLIYHRDIQSGMLLPFHNDSARQMAKDVLKDIQVNTTIYFGTLTVVNICLGIATTVLTWLVGLPHPFLWGTLAAVLNFIPYLGPAIVIATLFVVGLIGFPRSVMQSSRRSPISASPHWRGKSSRRPSSVIGSRSIHSSFSSPSHAGPGCGGRSAPSWPCPFSCARWWRCAGCDRQAGYRPPPNEYKLAINVNRRHCSRAPTR